MDAVVELKRFLGDRPAIKRVIVAYSGGLDSTALLHAAVQLRQKLTISLQAVHVHHGLMDEADQWVRHCQHQCNQWRVPLQVHHVRLPDPCADSIEAAARNARYRIFSSLADGTDAAVMLAQHQDDQAETLLLQLIRGAGLHGLAAMPLEKPLGAGRLVRPWLRLSQNAIYGYAMMHHLDWVDDPSNTLTAFDRNYLRHEILPRLAHRWPAIGSTLARSAAHMAEAVQLTEVLARQDHREAVTETDDCLLLNALRPLPDARLRNVLRYWIRSLGYVLPNEKRLNQLLQVIRSAREDRHALIVWTGVEVRQWRNRLYIMSSLPPAPPQNLPWRGQSRLPLLPGNDLMLVATPCRGAGIRASAIKAETCLIQFGTPGLQCRPAGRGCTKTLKNLYQEYSIPPWQRAYVPLITIDGAVAAVAGWVVCEPYAAKPGESGLCLSVTALHPGLPNRPPPAH